MNLAKASAHQVLEQFTSDSTSTDDQDPRLRSCKFRGHAALVMLYQPVPA